MNSITRIIRRFWWKFQWNLILAFWNFLCIYSKTSAQRLQKKALNWNKRNYLQLPTMITCSLFTIIIYVLQSIINFLTEPLLVYRIYMCCSHIFRCKYVILDQEPKPEIRGRRAEGRKRRKPKAQIFDPRPF